MSGSTVTPCDFETVGIPLIAKRDFTEGDRADTAGAVIINESLAQKYFTKRDPMNKQLTIGGLFDDAVAKPSSDTAHRGALHSGIDCRRRSSADFFKIST